jgi:hypothetical protein
MNVMLKNVEFWFAKLNPKRPNSKFNKENPTWELQIRTTSKEQKKEWEEKNLRVKAVIPDEEGAVPYYRVNLRKKSLKNNGEPNGPVQCVDHNLVNLNPDTVGNGSIGHVRLFQYEYGSDKDIASVLMGIQVVKHLVYTPNFDPNGGFEEEEGEVILPDDDDVPFETDSKSTPNMKPSVNNHSDDDF